MEFGFVSTRTKLISACGIPGSFLQAMSARLCKVLSLKENADTPVSLQPWGVTSAFAQPKRPACTLRIDKCVLKSLFCPHFQETQNQVSH